ncbi:MULTISPECIES: PH domain-containing protein [unclassified Halorubrum]|uniref:PH domain-containing protein n=1 Tax=unclassified Halorubrum TaxID=2642239 RepID=UPI000EF1D1E5|nr:MULTISPECIES: PH domain-containing protein [unclassified Halorubrum]RLM49950.1 PH domain-containing protein [Halorubrum sp. Atlit-28R]TKX42889.1 PH domain-containing protein [Halorubrum sp. ARQ200]
MSDTALQDISEDGSTDSSELDLDWLTLEDGESIQWSSTPHKYSVLPAFIIGIPLSLVLIGIPIVAASYLQYTNTNYVVTNRGLYSKRGVLSRDVQQIGFDKVQNISYSQSALGSYFGYGSVDVSTAGGSGIELQFRSIPAPAAVQELIAREIDSRQQTESDSTKEDVLDSILTELRVIRQAVADDQSGSQTDSTASSTDESTHTDTGNTDE